MFFVSSSPYSAVTGGYIEGELRVGGHPKEQATFARIAGYVEQFDIHSPQTTVHEALQFSAALRLPSKIDAALREVRGALCVFPAFMIGLHSDFRFILKRCSGFAMPEIVMRLLYGRESLSGRTC